MCETTTTLLRQETEEAARKKTEIDAHVMSLQLKFNETKKLLFSKRKGIDRMTVDISTIVNGELKEAKDKLTAATRKLNKAIDAARPENSRLTLAIAKTERIIDSIKENTAAAASKLLYFIGIFIGLFSFSFPLLYSSSCCAHHPYFLVLFSFCFFLLIRSHHHQTRMRKWMRTQSSLLLLQSLPMLTSLTPAIQHHLCC